LPRSNCPRPGEVSGAPPRLLATARVRPYLSKMQVDEFIRALERAQAHAYPGRESVETNSVLRELWRILQQQRAPAQLRLIRS
jgi:hypothetical protein